MFLLILEVYSHILVMMSEGGVVCKIWYTIIFFNNAYNILKTKHDVSYDIIMHYSFRAVAAHRQEIMTKGIHQNIKTQRQQNDYKWNNKNQYQRNHRWLKQPFNRVRLKKTSRESANTWKLIMILRLIFAFMTKNCNIMYCTKNEVFH